PGSQRMTDYIGSDPSLPADKTFHGFNEFFRKTGMVRRKRSGIPCAGHIQGVHSILFGQRTYIRIPLAPSHIDAVEQKQRRTGAGFNISKPMTPDAYSLS